MLRNASFGFKAVLTVVLLLGFCLENLKGTHHWKLGTSVGPDAYDHGWPMTWLFRQWNILLIDRTWFHASTWAWDCPEEYCETEFYPFPLAIDCIVGIVLLSASVLLLCRHAGPRQFSLRTLLLAPVVVALFGGLLSTSFDMALGLLECAFFVSVGLLGLSCYNQWTSGRHSAKES